MGTEAHVVVVGGSQELLERAGDGLRRFESLWSRFDPGSEISRLARAGTPLLVSRETAELVAVAVAGWEATDGRFDPTVGDAMAALGYDRSFERIAATRRAATDGPRPPGCQDIWVDIASRVVFVPATVAVDVGGIAKGFAADHVARDLIAGGARGACVNVGGDLRVIGDADDDDGWVVGIELPGCGEVARLAIDDGGVATSSTRRRRWRRDGHEVHHLLDPCTGRPADTRWSDVTVAASSATAAEVWTKALLVGAERTAVDVLPSDVVLAVARTTDGDLLWLDRAAG